MLPQRIRTSAVFLILLAVFGIMATAENASAQLQIRFEDPDQPSLPPLTVTDNDPNDLDPDPGSIAIFGITYGKFSIVQAVVFSKPMIGDSTQAEMDVNAFVTSSLGGKLTVTAADTGFTDPPEASLTLSSSAGGTISGSGSTVSFDAWANPADASPLSSAITTIPPGSAQVAMGPFGPPPPSFSGNGSTSFARSGPYSIFKQARVVLAAGGDAGWDQSTLVKGLHSSTELTTSSVSPATTVIAGTPVTIVVNEKNTGETTITGVSVTGTGCTTWTGGLSTLAPNTSTNFSCTFTPATTTTWTATGHGTDPAGNPVPLDNETTGGTVTVFTASTTLTTKSVTPGTQVALNTLVTVTVTETNTGDSAITNVFVTGTGACSSFSPASVASLAAGASVDFTCTFTATADTSWTATGHGTDMAGDPVSLAGETTSGDVTVFTASTSLTTKTVSPSSSVVAGTAVTITVNEKNTGNSAITNVFVTGTGCTTWTPASVASLAAGASVDFSCTFTPAATTNWTATGHGTDIVGNSVSLVGETTGGIVTVTPPSTFWCEKQPVQLELSPTGARFPGNAGPDVLVKVHLGQSLQSAVDGASDTNGDGFILVAVVAKDGGVLGGTATQSLTIGRAFPKPFGLIGCSVTLNDPTPSDALPTGRILSASSAPADGVGTTIFVMDLHTKGSNVAGWIVEGNGRYLRNVYGTNNAVGIKFVGNSNTMHNGLVENNSGAGLVVQGNSNLVTDTDAFGNGGNGVDVSGNNNQILKVDAGDSGKGNGGDGIHASGFGNVLQENDTFANGGDGIDLVATSGAPNVLKKNVAGDRGKGNLGNGILVSGNGNGTSNPIELEENKVKANTLMGIKVLGNNHQLKNNVSGGSGSGETNGSCEFSVASGNFNATGNKANGTTIAGSNGSAFPTGCIGN